MKKLIVNRQLDIILDSIADGVFTIDSDSNITYFNRAAEKITGVPRKLAIGQKCFDVLRANICQTSCALKATIEGGESRINLPVNILNSDGKTIPISISTSVLRDEQGKIVGGVETFRDLSAIETLRKALRFSGRIRNHSADIISKNHEIQQILNILPDVAISNSTVLIEGPSGSGKELFAKAIHKLSRCQGAYVAINCAALPDSLLESELFGYMKGAFSDAKADKPGRFARAEGGTLFLDEIGDISPALQAKLLRVIQEKEYEPLGATAGQKANVRIIAATNKDLAGLVKLGAFRGDLFYRLNVVRLSLPPLSRRREDIPLLIEHFISKFNAIKGKEIEGVSDDTLDILMTHDLPGNIRELENIIEYAFVLCRGHLIEVRHLPRELQESVLRKTHQEAAANRISPGPPPLGAAEAAAILDVLRKNGGSRIRTAMALGIDKTTLWRKMKKFGVTYR